MQKLQKDPQLGQYLQKSPILERTLNSFLSDKANAETLAGWGVKPGAVTLKAMEAQAQGQSQPAGSIQGPAAASSTAQAAPAQNTPPRPGA